MGRISRAFHSFGYRCLLAVALLSGRHSRHELGLVVGPDRWISMVRMSAWESLCGHLRQTLGMDKTLVISAEPDTPFELVQKGPDHQPGLRDSTNLFAALAQSVPGPGILMPPRKRSNVCERHKVKMEVELVPISYGLPIDDSAHWKEAEHPPLRNSRMHDRLMAAVCSHGRKNKRWFMVCKKHHAQIRRVKVLTLLDIAAWCCAITNACFSFHAKQPPHKTIVHAGIP